MTKPKASKVTISNVPGAEGQISQGRNMQVLIDGVKVPGATFVKFEVKASKLAKVTIELFAEVEVEATAELEQIDAKSIGKQQGKTIALYRLGSVCPVAVVDKE